MKLAALFPGQGSQSIGMGQNLSAQSDQAREIFHTADKALNFPLSKLCFEGPLETLTLTANAQPAILVTSYACFRELSLTISAAAGHSLGEYTALLAAGALSFEDAVTLVHKRGRYMQEAVPAGEGKMVAVMGPSEAEIQEVIQSCPEGIHEIANINSPGQIVVAGDSKGVAVFSEMIKQRGAKVIPLNVSAPFHCSLMKPAADKLAKDLDATSFAALSFPVYANVTGKPIPSTAAAKELLKQQVCGTVRWVDCMNNLVNDTAVTNAVEFGPGAVLSKLMKRIQPSIPCQEVFDAESLNKTRAVLN